MSPPTTNANRIGRIGPALPTDVRFAASSAAAEGGLLYRRSTGLVARIGAVEWEVLRRFDGSDVAGVRDCVERECGLRFTAADLAAFAHQALAIGLLESPGSSVVRSSRWRGLSWSVGLWNPERIFAWCASRAWWLFHPVTIGAGLLLIMTAQATFLQRAAKSTVPPIPVWHHIVLFLIVLNLVSIVHECGHGVALHRYGGSVREIGVRFVLGWPCWYCDITESYLLSRLRHRIAVILAGPLMQAVACAIVILAARGNGPHAAAIRNAAALLGVLTALNFFPLVRSDGYYLLAELAGLPNLRTDAWKWLGSSGVRQRMRAGLPAGRRLAVAAYGLASAAFMTLVFARSVTVIVRVVAGAGHFSISTVTAALSLMVILTTIVKRRSVSR